MKISVIMVDGGFRDNIYSAQYFSKQDFRESQYEIIWVEYYKRSHPGLGGLKNVKVITLGRTGEYHSSYCFNKGIEVARGRLLVIPDADQVVRQDFLSSLWRIHRWKPNLVTYNYRYNEPRQGVLESLAFDELDSKCVLSNPGNFGACLSVRKKWLLKINGYEMHPIFGSGFHANGFDVYTRLKALGLEVCWPPNLKLYHPWHPYTLAQASQYEGQQRLISWRAKCLNYEAIKGINKEKNMQQPPELIRLLKTEMNKLQASKQSQNDN